KGTMTATVNSNEGSDETKDAEGTTVWFFFSKKVFQRRTISGVCINDFHHKIETSVFISLGSSILKSCIIRNVLRSPRLLRLAEVLPRPDFRQPGAFGLPG